MDAEGVLQLGAVPSGSALPQDVLADILRRLPPRGLAVSQCVCKAWRDAVDDRRLLRADLLPCSVHGLILNFRGYHYPSFLSRPSTMGPDSIDIFAGAGVGPSPSSDPDCPRFVVPLDHCNGLVLFNYNCGLLVSNPATRRWTHLPRPTPFQIVLRFARLVFDPADSPHYEVVLVPRCCTVEEQIVLQLQEWPPSTWIMSVFSSLTGRWEQRSFAREGELVDLTTDDDEFSSRFNGAYWRGALYVDYFTGSCSVLRISLSDHKYRVISLPSGIACSQSNDIFLGRSEDGVCLALIDYHTFRLWILDESCDQIQWVFKHQIHLGSALSRVQACDKRIEGDWMLQDINFVPENLHLLPVNNDEGSSGGRLTNGKYEWDSDNDSILDDECEARYIFGRSVHFLGFHPFKPAVFLILLDKIVVFHLNTYKVQLLGVCPESSLQYYYAHESLVTACFPYTPCGLMEEFHGYKFEAPMKD